MDNNLIEQYFTRESILKILSSYELYYQISLTNLIYETLQDIKETNDTLKELNLHPLPSKILSTIYDLILLISHQEKFEQILEYQIRNKASMQALNDFTINDKGLLQIKHFIKQKTLLIEEDTFFTEKMYLQFKRDYSKVYDYFDLLYDEELTDQIKIELLGEKKK